MLNSHQITSATAWLKALPRHMFREHIKRAHHFGSGDMSSDQSKDREVLQQTACLAEAILQLLEEAEATAATPPNTNGDAVREALEALKPFAAVAENDIGEDEADADLFRPMSSRHNRAPLLTVGDLRRALATLAKHGGDTNV